MKVELSLHATGLKNVAGAFKGTSDPYAVVTHIATSANAKPVVLGKTEVVKNSLNPEWVKVFVLDYELGAPMKLVVSIFDEVRKNEHKSMGSAVLDVAELLGCRGNTQAKRLNSKGGGTLYANVRKAQGSGLLRLQLAGKDLKNVEGMMRKSDPLYEIRRQINSAGGQTWDNIFRSNAVMNNLNPVWDAAVLDLSVVCGGNHDLPLEIAVFDHESKGENVPMGKCETSVNGLLQCQGSDGMTLEIKGNKKGLLLVQRAEISGVDEGSSGVVTKSGSAPPPPEAEIAGAASGKPSFLDYISGACDLNVVVAIDFTGSNGDPRKPGTLHHVDDHSDNLYEKAVKSIVEILAKYDSDQSFPVLGFGAKYNGVVQHCFQCGDTEEVHGVDGVLNAYRSVFKSGLIMSSPTVFTDVMETAAARAAASLKEAQGKGGLAYTVLLIVTDGAVSDVNATAECLKQICDSPLSIVIVGVGDADFSGMEFLDDFKCDQDMAQFVQFNKHPQKDELTTVTLREIPDQLVGYFQKHGIPPGKAIVRDEAEIVVQDVEEEIDLSLDVIEGEILVSGGGFNTRGSW
jgi:Copine/C2 domain